MSNLVRRRIFFSLPSFQTHDGILYDLAPNHLRLIAALAGRVKRQGYEIEAFPGSSISDRPTATTAWGFDEADEVIRRCHGAVFIGIPRWIFTTPVKEWHLGSEYSHFEGALAFTHGLPRLILAEQGLEQRVIFSNGHGDYISTFPANADEQWLKTSTFRTAFNGWKNQVTQRRDLFLGYSGKSAETAKNIKSYLESLGATVLDWQTDFGPAAAILKRIEEAAHLCRAGVFLFTRDDALAGKKGVFAPRDNVVLEAGYFCAALGKERVLIVREESAKMPADFGGDIYAPLKAPPDISSAKGELEKFLKSL